MYIMACIKMLQVATDGITKWACSFQVLTADVLWKSTCYNKVSLFILFFLFRAPLRSNACSLPPLVTVISTIYEADFWRYMPSWENHRQ